MIKLLKNNFELLFWIAALVALAIANPAAENHFVLCPFRLIGITWCPGCGIGHSISYVLHGDIHNSFKAHWLGIPALAVTFHRIYTLMFVQSTKFKALKAYSYER